MHGRVSRQLVTCLTGLRGQVRSLFSFSDSTRAPATVPLTKELFGLKRGPYAEVTSDDISQLAALVGGRVETDRDDLLLHNTDWLRSLRGGNRQRNRNLTANENGTGANLGLLTNLLTVALRRVLNMRNVYADPGMGALRTLAKRTAYP